MKRILLTSHGRLASGLKDTLEFFLGQSEMIAAVDAYVDTSSELSATAPEVCGFCRSGESDHIHGYLWRKCESAG